MAHFKLTLLDCAGTEARETRHKALMGFGITSMFIYYIPVLNKQLETPKTLMVSLKFCELEAIAQAGAFKSGILHCIA